MSQQRGPRCRRGSSPFLQQGGRHRCRSKVLVAVATTCKQRARRHNSSAQRRVLLLCRRIRELFAATSESSSRLPLKRAASQRSREPLVAASESSSLLESPSAQQRAAESFSPPHQRACRRWRAPRRCIMDSSLQKRVRRCTTGLVAAPEGPTLHQRFRRGTRRTRRCTGGLIGEAGGILSAHQQESRRHDRRHHVATLQRQLVLVSDGTTIQRSTLVPTK